MQNEPLDPKDESPQNPDGDKKTPRYSGFIILRLSGDLPSRDDKSDKSLEEFAGANKLTRLSALLEQYPPSSIRRTITSVSPEKLRALEEKAKKSAFPPLNSLANYWRLDFRDSVDSHDEIVEAFQSLPEVELAYREMTATDPTIDASDDDLSGEQGYLDAAPLGIDARWAWTRGGEGAGVGFIDLEQGWIPDHEDLAAAAPTLVFNDNVTSIGDTGDHGTAVLGEIVGVDNDRGIVGIAPSVSYVKMVSHFEAASGSNGHVADAIVAAITHMNTGDVLLLEVQRNKLPTEIDSADFDAIRLAVANGIVVVEAAGNEGDDLDTWENDAGVQGLRRDPRFDSGAIMVGAGRSALAAGNLSHNRLASSNSGSRIDCYAWGENIATTGFADRRANSLGGEETDTLEDDYTGSFDGTSGASPIIAGAALILQGLYKTASGTILSPLQMRALLSNPDTGTPQGTGVAGNIGVMPNLRAIIEDSLELTPDVYLRDNIGDNGHVPSAGAISASPDIIVRSGPILAPDTPTILFGEGSGTENSNSFSSDVEFGQDNFICVRMKNRGGIAANGVTATVYWSRPSTLVTPNLWTPIGTSSPVNVPAGDTLVVTPPITWAQETLPPTVGHYCFIGILNHPQDGAPPVPGPDNFDWDDFTALIRNHNNVTWRNFNVIDAVIPATSPSDGSGGGGGRNDSRDAEDANEAVAQEKLEFDITGAPDKERNFDIEFMRALPQGAKARLELPAELFALIDLPGAEVQKDKAGETVSVLLLGVKNVRLNQVALPKLAKYKCRLLITGGTGYEKGAHQIAVRQIFEGLEVGRISWELKPPKKPSGKTGLSLWCRVLLFLFIILLIWFLLTLIYFLTR